LRKEWDLLPENELVISGPGPFIMMMDPMGFRRASSAAKALFGRLFFWLISRLWLICCERKTLFHG
jgi:hypothetical protein